MKKLFHWCFPVAEREEWLEKYELDVLIEISRLQARTLDFHNAAELIHIGKQKMNSALDKLEHGS